MTINPPAHHLRTWRIDLPWQSPPLSLNDRSHWRAKARKTAAARSDATYFARAHRLPALDRVSFELHYVPRDSRRRDPINLTLTLKAIEDGMVDAGVVPDDTPQFVEPTMPVIDPPSGNGGRMYVVVRELAALAATP